MSAFIYLSIFLGFGLGVALGRVAPLEWHLGVRRVLEGDGEVHKVEVQVLELQVGLG